MNEGSLLLSQYANRPGPLEMNPGDVMEVRLALEKTSRFAAQIFASGCVDVDGGGWVNGGRQRPPIGYLQTEKFYDAICILLFLTEYVAKLEASGRNFHASICGRTYALIVAPTWPSKFK